MMKRVPILALTMLVTASLVWIGCSSPDSPGSTTDDLMTRTQTTDFDDPYGGFNMADEPPAFGDASLDVEFGDDADIADVYADDPAVKAFEERFTRNVRCNKYLMITWGNLHRDSLDHRTDWTGGLEIENGVVLLKKTIRFEDNDRILPRERRDLLEWESTTGRHLDGVLVKVIPVRPNSSTVTTDAWLDTADVWEETIVRFKTPPLSVEFTLKDTETFPRVVQLDDGNCVAFDVVTVCRYDCAHGFTRGVWRNHPERMGGTFIGSWVTANGEHRGFLRGHYGVNSNGEKRFFGKWIARNGRFEALVVGEWGNNEEFGGWFSGRLVGRSRTVIGGLKGQWQRSDHCNGGVFRGRWQLRCASVIDGNS